MTFDQQPLTGGSTSAPAPAGGTSLFGALRRRLALIVATTAIVTGVAVAFVVHSGNHYTSTAVLLYGQTLGPELNALGLTPVAVDAASQTADDLAMASSHQVAALAAHAMGGGFTAASVQTDVAVAAAKAGQVVNVTATLGSAQRSARLANSYANAAVMIAKGQQRVRARTTARALTRQLHRLPPTQETGPAGINLRIRIAQLQALEASGTGSPSIIQSGFVPTSASGSMVEYIVLGVLLGLLLGVGLALLREQADQRLRHAGEVSVAFEAPVLATIPRNRALARRQSFDQLPPAAAEALQMLQANLRYGFGKPLRSVLVTSSRARDGKTTVSWNLAQAAVSSGLSVILVDADLRRSSLAAAYDLQPFPGLAEVLGGDTSVAQALQTVALNAVEDPTESETGELTGYGSPTLDVLTAGSAPSDPSALLQSPQMTELLRSLQRHYDLVIVDTPPIAQVADAIALLKSADGVLVVASVNATRGPDAERLRDQLQALDARVLGVVANGGTGTSSYRSSRRTGAPSA